MRHLSLVFAALLSQANKFKLFSLGTAWGFLVALTAPPTHAQTCAPTPSGMVAWWPGDGNAVDMINRIAGTPVGGVTYGTVAQGKVSQAFSFSGSGVVSITSAPTSNEFTIDAWVFPKAYSSWPYVTIYADNSRGLWLKDGKINWWSPKADRFIGNNPPIPTNTWTHIALTYDSNGKFTGYRNGQLDGSSDYPGEFLPTLTGTGIGGHGAALEPFNGLIDEVEIFNRALTQVEIKAIYDAGSAGKCKPKRGMTWIQGKSDATTGTITVGCSGCDAYHGDTACTELRPLLCIYKPTPPFQLPKGLDNSDQYNQWSGGVVATTQPVAGNTFEHISAAPGKDANSYCKDKFGPGWRVAEFHDGGIWNFQAYGGTVTPPTIPPRRFWVHINDQKDGNCWDTP